MLSHDHDRVLNTGQGYGPVHHSRHILRVGFGGTGVITGVLNRIYDALKVFTWFNANSNQTAMTAPVTTDDGTLFICFDARGLFGWAASIINGRWVPVRVWSQRSARLVTGDTCGTHMLVGQRRWHCEPADNATIVVTTESYDHPRGLWNWLGFRSMGKVRQVEIWTLYFQNIARHLQKRHGATSVNISIDLPEEATRPSDWGPRDPYPGDEIP